MGFETVVLDKVAKVIKQDRQAEFCSGTLFVTCEEKQARSIFHKLSKDYGVGKIQISCVTAHEYCFDFVA